MTVLNESQYAGAYYSQTPAYYAPAQSYASVQNQGIINTICLALKPLCPYIWMIALAGGGIAAYGIIRHKQGKYIIGGGGAAIGAILIGKYCCGNIGIPVIPPSPVVDMTKPMMMTKGGSKPTNKPMSSQPQKAAAKTPTKMPTKTMPMPCDTSAFSLAGIACRLKNFGAVLTDPFTGIKAPIAVPAV